MIDVVFLLIIFFMIITKFNQERLELLVLPQAQEAIVDPGEKDRVVINLNTLGEIKIDGELYTPETLPDRLKAEISEVDFGGGDVDLDQLREGEGSKVVVLLRASRDVQYYHTQKIIKILTQHMIRPMEWGAKKK